MHAPPGINSASLYLLYMSIKNIATVTIYYNTNTWVQEEGDYVSSHVESEAEDNI